MLRQIEWGTKLTYSRNGVLPVTTFLFQKFCFSLGTSYIELIWCTNHPNVHIHTFQKHWSFSLGCFFPVSILKINLNAAEIRNVQDYLCTKNQCEWKSTYTVLKLRVKQVTYESNTKRPKPTQKAGNIWVKYKKAKDSTKRPKLKENQLGILGISFREFRHYVGNSAEGLMSRKERCWGYISIFGIFGLIYWCV